MEKGNEYQTKRKPLNKERVLYKYKKIKKNIIEKK